MIKYFTDKLQAIKRDIESTQKSIIQDATSLDVKRLVSLSETLLAKKNAKDELIRDCVEYCTIDEVIQIATMKEKYSEELMNLVTPKELAYFYKYPRHNRGISIADRQKLMDNLSTSEFREAKLNV